MNKWERKAKAALNKKLDPSWIDDEAQELLQSYQRHCEGSDKAPAAEGGSIIFTAIDPGTGTPMTAVDLGDGFHSKKSRRFVASLYLAQNPGRFLQRELQRFTCLCM